MADIQQETLHAVACTSIADSALSTLLTQQVGGALYRNFIDYGTLPGRSWRVGERDGVSMQIKDAEKLKAWLLAKLEPL